MKHLVFLFAIVLSVDVYSQSGYFFVWFKDKANNSYSLTDPSAYLSQRAIQRRQNQNISIDSLDLPVSNNYLSQLINKGISIHFTSKWLNGAMVRIDSAAVLDSLMPLPFVKSVTYTRPLVAGGTKIEKFSHEKSFSYGLAANQINMLKGEFLHDQNKTGHGMLIAVLDAGFLGVDTISVFDSLRNQNRIILTRDFVDGHNDAYVYESHSHGTMVLGTMAVLRNGTFVGTAPHAQYALIRTEDGSCEYIFEEYCWVAGAELADSIGADLINSSLGYILFDDPSMNHTWADLNGKTSVASRAATIAARKGMICTISAGNWGAELWRKIGIPSDADSVLCVGAVDPYGDYAFFSSQGYSADGRVKPDVCAQGQNISTVAVSGNYTISNGTSFSSPILCGLVACLWQTFPTKKNMEIIDAVKQSASQYQNPDSLLGYGIPNFQTAYYYLTNINPLSASLFEIVTLSPNPTKGKVIIQYRSPVSQTVEFQITTVEGKTVKMHAATLPATEKGEYILDLSELASGMYYVVVKTTNYQQSFSVIKYR